MGKYAMKIRNRWLVAVVAMAAAGWLPAAALSVNCQAGGLREAVGADTDVKSLVVSGSVNAADFDFIVFEMPGLDNLDLSGTVVSAYDGEPTFTGRTSSPANVLPDGALMSVKASTIHLPGTLEEIGSGALADIGATTVVLPRCLKRIGVSAFSNSRNLTTVVVPESVSRIGAGAFKNCPSLKSVVVKGAIEAVEPQTFMGCVALESVELPESVVFIGAESFAGCRSLVGIEFPASLRTIGVQAFYGAGLKRADLGECRSLTAIGDWSFAANEALTEAVMPPSVERLGKGAFFNDASLALSKMPASLVEIDDFALRRIGSAEPDVLLHTAVKSVGDFALAGWKGISKFYLPAGLERMGSGAMANWSGLYSLSAEWVAEIPLLGEDVWRGVNRNNVLLFVPEGDEDLYASALQWQDFRIRGVEPGGVDAPEADEAGLTVSCEGMVLHVAAPVAIAGVDLFGTDGRSYGMNLGGGENTASIDTSAWDTPVLIVRVRLTDGRMSALKLVR